MQAYYEVKLLFLAMSLDMLSAINKHILCSFCAYFWPLKSYVA